MNRFKRSSAILVGLLLVSAGSLAAQDFEWQGTVERGDALEIRGVNGRIEAVAASGNRVRVTATKKEGRKGNVDDVKIEVVEHSGGVVICAIYPNRPGKRPNVCDEDGGHSNIHDNDTRVDFRVEVPAGVDLAVGTVNGDVVVQRVAGDVKASTVNGDVRVESDGNVEASTVNGSIMARMGQDLKSDLSFATVNGSLTIELPDGANANIEASTVNGHLESDFPLTIQGRFSNRRMRGQIGDGGYELELTTVNGGITIRRT